MKQKISIWANIVIICFCICAIVAGVYSATSASLTASGQIGFTAHGCDVDITGTIYGHATDDDAENGVPVALEDAVDLNDGNTLEVRGDTQTLPIGDRYFSDLESETGQPANIVITITVTNVSLYAVTATIDESVIVSPDTVSVSVDTTSATIAVDGTATFVITLTLTDTDGAYEELTPTEDNFSLVIAFAKSA